MAVSVRQALLDHSLGKLGPAGVMRALVTHEDWHVPVHALARPPSGPVIAFAEPGTARLALNQLNVFSDRIAAEVAVEKFGRAPMGTYVAGVPGTQLFARLLAVPALTPVLMLQVNPGSAIEAQWFIERNAFGLCAAWASAIGLEQAIFGDQPGWAAAMRDYQGWLAVLGAADSTLVRMHVREKGEQALIFTAPDLAERFLAGLPDGGGATCKLAPIAGRHLFKFVERSGVRGFIVNSGSAAKMFDASVCRQILG